MHLDTRQLKVFFCSRGREGGGRRREVDIRTFDTKSLFGGHVFALSIVVEEVLPESTGGAARAGVTSNRVPHIPTRAVCHYALSISLSLDLTGNHNSLTRETDVCIRFC